MEICGFQGLGDGFAACGRLRAWEGGVVVWKWRGDGAWMVVEGGGKSIRENVWETCICIGSMNII